MIVGDEASPRAFIGKSSEGDVIGFERSQSGRTSNLGQSVYLSRACRCADGRKAAEVDLAIKSAPKAAQGRTQTFREPCRGTRGSRWDIGGALR
jgi:hypothetical protein